MVYKKKKTLISNIANLSYLACGVGFSFTQFYLLQKLLLIFLELRDYMAALFFMNMRCRFHFLPKRCSKFSIRRYTLNMINTT